MSPIFIGDNRVWQVVILSQNRPLSAAGCFYTEPFFWEKFTLSSKTRLASCDKVIPTSNLRCPHYPCQTTHETCPRYSFPCFTIVMNTKTNSLVTLLPLSISRITYDIIHSRNYVPFTSGFLLFLLFLAFSLHFRAHLLPPFVGIPIQVPRTFLG